MKKLFVTFLLTSMLAIHAAAEVKTFKLTVLSDGDYGLTGRYEVPDIEIKVDFFLFFYNNIHSIIIYNEKEEQLFVP